MKERVFPNVIMDSTPGSSCLLWTGARNGGGYGQVLNQGVHRILYEMVHGPIPKPLTLDHLCRVRRCVNPRHMEAVTLKENLLRGEGPPAQNARKTHCRRGHLLDDDNLDAYALSKGRRACKQCRTIYRRRLYVANKLNRIGVEG